MIIKENGDWVIDDSTPYKCIGEEEDPKELKIQAAMRKNQLLEMLTGKEE